MTDRTEQTPGMSLREQYLAKREADVRLCDEIEKHDPRMAASARRILSVREATQ